MKEKLIKFLKEHVFYWLGIFIIIVISNYRLPYFVSAPGGIIDIKANIEDKRTIIFVFFLLPNISINAHTIQNIPNNTT